MKTLLLENTITQQSRLAGYCRTGVLQPIDGLTPNRVHNYRRLVYNVVDDTLRTAYPLTLDLLEEDEWNELVNSFFTNHSCQSASVWQMPKEFIEYVVVHSQSLIEKYPMLIELLHFEWIEIELYMMEDKIIPSFTKSVDLENNVVVFNPEHIIAQYSYPFHHKNPNEINEVDKGNYFILIFRDLESGEVKFVNISYLFAWLIQTIADTNKSLKEVCQQASSEFNIEYDLLIEKSKELFNQLYSQKYILGFKNE